MKKLILLIVCSILVLSGCGKTINPEVLRKMRLVVSDYVSLSSSHYKDEVWNNDNYLRIYHPDYYQDTKIKDLLVSMNQNIETVEGIKIFKQFERKDIRQIPKSNEYLIRNDFTVIAIMKEDKLQSFDKPKIISQYYWLKMDEKDNDLYKIIDMYPTVLNQEFIFIDTFISNSTDFTQNVEAVNQVKVIKSKIKE